MILVFSISISIFTFGNNYSTMLGTWRFIVSICAILGGMFSVMRIVDVLMDLLMKFFVKDSMLT